MHAWQRCKSLEGNLCVVHATVFIEKTALCLSSKQHAHTHVSQVCRYEKLYNRLLFLSLGFPAVGMQPHSVYVDCRRAPPGSQICVLARPIIDTRTCTDQSGYSALFAFTKAFGVPMPPRLALVGRLVKYVTLQASACCDTLSFLFFFPRVL